MNSKHLLGVAIVVCGLGCANAASAATLVLYCSADPAWCEKVAEAFQEKTKIEVDLTAKPVEETYGQILTEEENPKADVWWGGSVDTHLQAVQDEKTVEYKSPRLEEVRAWGAKLSEVTANKTIGIHAAPLGFAYNRDVLAASNLPEPKCWEDLTKPEYKGHIQLANPIAADSSYRVLATMVQLFGEAKGFDYMKALHRNLSQYTKSGTAPIEAAARGETAIGIGFMRDSVTQAAAGAPLVTVAPCEGTGYELAAMSLVKGLRHEGAAKEFYDWALSGEMQTEGKEFLQIPSANAAEQSASLPDPATIKLIDYDFVRYGSEAERRRLLAKWDMEVSILPQ